MKIELNKVKLETSEEIRMIQKKLKRYPEGELHCQRNGKYVKWFNNSTYIKKSERSQAVALAEKKYYKLQLGSLLLRQKMIGKYERLNEKNKEKLEEMLEENSPYIQLLSENVLTTSKKIREWMCDDYPRNLNYPENLIHKTYAGHMVRSKSEGMIANALFLHTVPYRYENILSLGETSLAPDFTIIHPTTKSKNGCKRQKHNLHPIHLRFMQK